MRTRSLLSAVLRLVAARPFLLLLLAAGLSPQIALSAADATIADKTREAVQSSKTAVQEAVENSKSAVQDAVQSSKSSVAEAGRAVSDSFENLWRRVDDRKLRSRQRDEIAAWTLTGLLIGLLASLKISGFDRIGRVLVALAGACLGGVLVQVAQINFGWGPVLIRYEELLFALLGACTLLLGVCLLRSRKKDTAAAGKS